MERKTKYQIIAGFIGAIIIGLISFVFFVGYGGNNCDSPPSMTCDCFCCHMFNSRGYESCGIFGFWFGIIIGVILGILTVHMM
jgi:hypothetical protein